MQAARLLHTSLRLPIAELNTTSVGNPARYLKSRADVLLAVASA